MRSCTCLDMSGALLFWPPSPQGSAQGSHRQVLRDPVRRAAYDRRAAVTQLHAGGTIAEELDLDDFSCSLVAERCLHTASLLTLQAASPGQHAAPCMIASGCKSCTDCRL